MVALGRRPALRCGPPRRLQCRKPDSPTLAMLLRREGEVSRHHRRKLQQGARPAIVQMQMKWRLLLPGASEPRLAELNPLGLQNGLSNCVTQPEQPEHSCRLQLLHSPITAEQYREKTRPFRPRRSCFAPAEARICVDGLGWRRRVLPPGPNGLLRRQFISIAGEPARS